jgi:chromosome segregation ATPase
MKNEVEEIEAELSTLSTRRETISADLASATAAAREATQAIVNGASATAALIATGGAKAVLQDALAAIVARIEPLQNKLSTAKADAEKVERAANYEAALKTYDGATLEVAALIKEFSTGNAAALQALDAAHSAVNHAEREMIRAGERRYEQTGALQHRRDCGDVRPFLAHLQDYLQGKTYASVSAPTEPAPARDLSKAGIV